MKNTMFPYPRCFQGCSTASRGFSTGGGGDRADTALRRAQRQAGDEPRGGKAPPPGPRTAKAQEPRAGLGGLVLGPTHCGLGWLGLLDTTAPWRIPGPQVLWAPPIHLRGRVRLSRAGICAGPASARSSACPPQTSCAAALDLGQERKRHGPGLRQQALQELHPTAPTPHGALSTASPRLRCVERCGR